MGNIRAQWLSLVTSGVGGFEAENLQIEISTSLTTSPYLPEQFHGTHLHVFSGMETGTGGVNCLCSDPGQCLARQ